MGHDSPLLRPASSYFLDAYHTLLFWRQKRFGEFYHDMVVVTCLLGSVSGSGGERQQEIDRPPWLVSFE